MAKVDLHSDAEGERFCRILAAIAGDESGAHFVRAHWGFAPIPGDGDSLLMYPAEPITPNDSHLMMDTVANLQGDGFQVEMVPAGGGTALPLRGAEEVAIVVKADLPDAVLARWEDFRREPPPAVPKTAPATWWWSVMVGGSALASYSVEAMGTRGAKKAAKGFGKDYIRQGGSGYPQLQLTRTMPEGSTNRTSAGP